MRISDWSSDVCSSDLKRSCSTYLRTTPKRPGRSCRCARTVSRAPFLACGPALIRTAPGEHGRRAGRLAPSCLIRKTVDRKSVVKGKSVSVRVDLGGRRIIKKKKQNIVQNTD